MRAESASRVRYALNHIDEFYRTRKSLNYRGAHIDVNKSPVSPQPDARCSRSR